MKNLKILFTAILLTCFVGITQSNAQALVDNYEGVLTVMYEAEDGTMVNITITGDVHGVKTPSGNWNYEFKGMIPEGIPLPKSAVKYNDGVYEILITPSGEVLSWFKIKKPKD